MCSLYMLVSLTRFLTDPASAAGSGTELHLRQMWPYWMPRHEAVANDVALGDEMVALSGPNMGGKSTFLRALTAAVLLVNCGLPVPAAAGSSVPEVRGHAHVAPFVGSLLVDAATMTHAGNMDACAR